MICELQDKIFSAGSDDFDTLALEVFRMQYRHNVLYRQFTDTLGVDPLKVNDIHAIPFLPVGFFKGHDVTAGVFDPEVIFESSGTTGSLNSRHLVRYTGIYRKSFTEAFRLFYGDPADCCIAGLLPSYLERQSSSLVMMVKELIEASGQPGSGFYLYDHQRLWESIRRNEREGRKTLLIGVTFALLDFAEAFPEALYNTVVMETGGMKGRRKELTREEVHRRLSQAWQLRSVHSEYGMTELLSQAYSAGNGLFRCPPWMKVLMRDEDDPLMVKTAGTDGPVQGLVNVIDLANLHSCSFIAVDDIGKLYADGSFEISGRMDNSDVRGCSLMYYA